MAGFGIRLRHQPASLGMPQHVLPVREVTTATRAIGLCERLQKGLRGEQRCSISIKRSNPKEQAKSLEEDMRRLRESQILKYTIREAILGNWSYVLANPIFAPAVFIFS